MAPTMAGFERFTTPGNYRSSLTLVGGEHIRRDAEPKQQRGEAEFDLPSPDDLNPKLTLRVPTMPCKRLR